MIKEKMFRLRSLFKVRGKKIILLALLMMVILGTLLIKAQAASIGLPESARKAASEMTKGLPSGIPLVQEAKETTNLLVILANLTAKVLTWVAAAVDFATNLGNDVLDLAAVKIGWQVVLGFTNLGFVLAIIVIAFATIFRMQSYAMKQTLWKLIVAALLVNFSLVIAGAFISVSNNVSDRMVEVSIGKNGSNLSNALANAVNPAAFGEVKEYDASFWQGVKAVINASFAYIAGLVFIIVFSFLIILAFAALFVMLLVRAIALVFLLVLSPLVWLLWIFPATASYWQKWWKEFIRWNFFAPAVFFFIYLAIATAACINPNQTCPIKNSQGTFQGETLSSITAAKSTADSAAIIFNQYSIVGKDTDIDVNKEGFWEHTMNLLVVLSLLFGGIYVANKFSIAGGKQAYGAAQGAGKAFGGWVGRKGVRTAGWAAHPSDRMLDWATDPRAGKVKQFIGRRMYGVQSGLSKIPGLKQLGGAYRGKGAHKNLFASVWGGMKAGSGLFKGKQGDQWECQNMIGTPPALCGNEVTSTKKPTIPCSRSGCGAINWKKI